MRQLSFEYGPAARMRIGRGPRAVERALLVELDELLEEPARLAEPVLVVVPSASLRRHVLARVLAHRQGAVLGLDCRTHLGLAKTLVESAGGAAAAGFAAFGDFDFFALFARRLARRERSLVDSLDHLVDGYGAVLAAVRDLLDAGFEPAHADALDEALSEEGGAVATRPEIERARALLRVASASRAELERWGLGRSSDLLARATLVARQQPLRASRVLIHGFNDATGLTIDFLLALLATHGGTFFLDHPPDPADRSRADPGLAFSRNFRERVETAVPVVDGAAAGSEPKPPRIETIRALGAEAETREVARRIRRLLGAGVSPESIGVVVRRLEDYAAPLRTQLTRLAVPFSADQRLGPYDPRASRLHAFVQLLRDSDRLPVERWLDASSLARDWSDRADLLLGLHTLGAGRLGEAAKLDLTRIEQRGGLALAAGRGFEERDDEPGTYRAARRWAGVETLEAATAEARAITRALERWPRRATAAGHGERLATLLGDDLGWERRDPEWSEPFAELERVVATLPAQLEIDFEELLLVLTRELSEYGRTELGGSGGGVQVLDVTAARSLTFDHLFVLGLNRGVFPRQVREDPILPDPLRQVLGRSGFGVLPDLPVKRSGFHEERFLFAQLLSASPRVTLSWPEVDDQQMNLRAVSPLVERLQLAAEAAGDELAPATARPVFSPGAEDATPRPAWEATVLAGLAGDRDAFGRVLEIALGGRDGHREDDPAALAAARIAALDEADPARDRSPAAFDRLGPWLGAVGEIAAGDDPRPHANLFITALEQIARCPWKYFLQRVLRVERLPDPLEAVPGVDPQLIGLLVHDALEAIVARSLGSGAREWSEVLETPGSEVPWPDPEELESLLLERARALVGDRDLGLPGLDRALVLAAAPHLEIARREDWPENRGRWPVMATEIAGYFDLAAATGAEAEDRRRIHFRADRMDRTNDGYSFTDYKTGRWSPPGPASATAGERLLAGVRGGEWLQAAAYAMAGGERPSRGRYLYVSPLFADDVGREFMVTSGQAVLVQNFTRAVTSILGVWDHGMLFPRLVDARGNEPKLCSFCDVSDACVRGDSGARRRLTHRLESWRDDDDTSEAEAAVVAAWDLARPDKGKGRR